MSHAPKNASEEIASLRRGNFTYFPVVPGRMEFSIELRQAIGFDFNTHVRPIPNFGQEFPEGNDDPGVQVKTAKQVSPLLQDAHHQEGLVRNFNALAER